MSHSLDPYEPGLLPAAIATYLEARDSDRTRAVPAFTEDAVVVDEGRTHTGIAAVRDWIERSSTAFSYTITHLGQEQISDREWHVVDHLKGDFPGGEATLRLRFVLAGGRIRELAFAPERLDGTRSAS